METLANAAGEGNFFNDASFLFLRRSFLLYFCIGAVNNCTQFSGRKSAGTWKSKLRAKQPKRRWQGKGVDDAEVVHLFTDHSYAATDWKSEKNVSHFDFMYHCIFNLLIGYF